MSTERPEPNPDLAGAIAAFNPERFAFRRHERGWVKDFPGCGPVVVTSLGWQHAQSPSYDVIDGTRVETDALGLIGNLQRRVWGFPPELIVPTNVMAIIPDGGGGVLAAYRLDAGFNADGWLGFIIGFGARSGVLVSHMLAVREDARGASDFGWHMKIVQGYEALRAGHHAMGWTFDPMRGANAKLNLEKLGATVRDLTLDKYGVLRSSLYRNAPSDRFTAYWDLRASRTHECIAAVADGDYQPPSAEDLNRIPEATVDNIDDLVASRAVSMRYRIPGDIDALMESDPDRGVAWRNEMRTVLSKLLTTKRVPAPGHGVAGDPAALNYEISSGFYEARRFATSLRPDGERDSQYVFVRTDNS